MPSALSEDTASSASLGHLKAPAAPTQPGAPPPQRGGSPWAQHPASGRPKAEDLPLSTSRPVETAERALTTLSTKDAAPVTLVVAGSLVEVDPSTTC